MVIDGIIFDLDGTLWDSVDEVVASWNTVIEQCDDLKIRLTREMVMSVMGMQLPDIAKKLFAEVDEERRKTLIKKCSEVECDYLAKKGATLYGHLEETLKVLSKKYKLCIVSNCQAGYIETFLEAHQMQQYFVDIQDAETTGLSKGENIQLVIKRNQFKNAVYVGDTEGDQKSAEFANVPFVYARYGFGDVKKYDYVIDQFKDLLSFF